MKKTIIVVFVILSFRSNIYSCGVCGGAGFQTNGLYNYRNQNFAGLSFLKSAYTYESDWEDFNYKAYYNIMNINTAFRIGEKKQIEFQLPVNYNSVDNFNGNTAQRGYGISNCKMIFNHFSNFKGVDFKFYGGFRVPLSDKNYIRPTLINSNSFDLLAGNLMVYSINKWMLINDFSFISPVYNLSKTSGGAQLRNASSVALETLKSESALLMLQAGFSYDSYFLSYVKIYALTSALRITQKTVNCGVEFNLPLKSKKQELYGNYLLNLYIIKVLPSKK